MTSESDVAATRGASAQARHDEPAPRRGLARLLHPNLLVPILVVLHVVLCLVGLWSFGMFALGPDEMDQAAVARNLAEARNCRAQYASKSNTS